MAVLKILHMKEAKTGQPSRHLKNGIKYILNPEKTENGLYQRGIHCIPANAYETMIHTKELYGKKEGRQGYHLIISFENNEKDKLYQVIGEFASRFLRQNYEAVYCLHTNTEHLHGHIIFNSVSVNGYKWHYKKGDWEMQMIPLLNEICLEHGLSPLTYDKERVEYWDRYKHGKDTYGGQICADIDRFIEQSKSYDDLIKLLMQEGYEVKQGKYLSLRPPEGKRFHRTYQYGELYTKEGLLKRIVSRENNPTIEKIGLYKKTFYEKYGSSSLSEFQTQYRRRLYRLGVLQYAPFSVAYQFKQDIRKMEQYQKELDYLMKYNIKDKEELIKRKEMEEKQLLETEKERRRLYQEKRESIKTMKNSKEYCNILKDSEIWSKMLHNDENSRKIEENIRICNQRLSRIRKNKKLADTMLKAVCVIPEIEERGMFVDYVPEQTRINIYER